MRYEKPRMEKVAIRSNTNLADTCWGFAANGAGSAPIYYYEFSNSDWLKDEAHPNGYGKDTWIGFQITKGDVQNCKSVSGISYFIRTYGTAITENGLQAQADAALEKVLKDMGAIGGNGASNFNAASTSFSTTVGNSW